MNEPHDELVSLWAVVPEAERVLAVAHVRGCAACRELLPVLGVAFDALESSAVAPVPVGAMERLLARTTSGRLDHFAAQVSELFDLSLPAAAALLQGELRWEEGPASGVWIVPVAPGPRISDSLTALVKLEPGARFPLHPHFGTERVLVMEGGYRDSGGVEVWRGEWQTMAAGTEHDFVAFADVGCICASCVVLQGEATAP